MKKSIILALFGLLVFCSASDADRIYLKDGNFLHGEIAEETPFSVKIITKGGIPRLLYRHEVKEIVKEAMEDISEVCVASDKRLRAVENKVFNGYGASIKILFALHTIVIGLLIKAVFF